MYKTVQLAISDLEDVNFILRFNGCIYDRADIFDSHLNKISIPNGLMAKILTEAAKQRDMALGDYIAKLLEQPKEEPKEEPVGSPKEVQPNEEKKEEVKPNEGVSQ